ncbi:hypothetical protein MMC13_005678 [Lambiella insularis]|nr:hypothetical protein [Lambiella insularis]
MDTGIIGPITVMTSYVTQFGLLSPIIHGLIVSSILIPAAISSFFAGRVADILGRPKAIAIGSFIFGLGAALEAGANSIAMFVIGRCTEGIGEGLYLGTLVVYICEISPPSRRGPLTTAPQLLITLGLVSGFFTCYGTANIESSLAWRAPFIILACLSVMFSIAAAFWLVPSPRWLSFRGRQAEASAVWDVLGVDNTEREKVDGQQSRDAALEPRSLAPAARIQTPLPKLSFFDVFSQEVRTRTILAMFLMGMQQLSGIDGVLYYAPLLFQQAGLASSQAAFLASGVSAIVIFAVTIPALFLSDKWGRRHSTIYGGIGLTATMFLIGGLYAGNAVHGTFGAGRWVVIVSIYVFAVIFCTSWAVGIKPYAAEIQPQRTRASATSLAHGSNWVTNFLVALATPILLAKSSFGAYFLFGGCTLVTAIVCALFMPETRGKSLDDIENAFKRSSLGSRGFKSLFRKDSLVLSALNTSKSANASFAFNKDAFFQAYHFRSHAAVSNRSGDTDGRFTCQLYNKALLSVFKGRMIDARERDTSIERCEVNIQDGPGKAECRLVVKMICGHGVKKTYRLTYESMEVVYAVFDKNAAQNHWAINAQVLKSFVEYFGAKTEQLDMYYESGRVTFTSYTEKITNGKEILRQPLQTSISLDSLDFEDFAAEEKLHIGISVRDFKAIVTHGETLKTTVTASYSHSSRPIQLAYNEHGMKCEFTLMTIGEYRGGSVNPAPVVRKGQARSSARPEATKTLPHTGSQPKPDIMPPPAKPASRVIGRESANQRHSKPSPPPPQASIDHQSLFVPEEDDDSRWNEKNYDDDEDQLCWGDSADNVVLLNHYGAARFANIE